MTTRRSRRLRWALLVVVLSLGVSAATAAPRFGDIPDGGDLSGATARLADSGITAGCSEDPPRYCPSASLTRAQMALFLDRIAGRSAGDSSVAPLASAGGAMGATPVTVTLTAGGVPGGTGFVTLQGSVSVLAGSASGCPCEVEAYVYRLGDDVQGPSTWGQLDSQRSGDTAKVSVPVSWHVPIPSGTTAEYGIGVFVEGSGLGSSTAEGSLTAVWTPYGEG